jgi:cell division septation protein DedD
VLCALALRGFAPIWVLKVKERLTGAIILVVLIVLVVPELLTGPIRSTPPAAAVASSAEEPPLRSYTINLAEETHSRTGAHGASGPQQPAPLAVQSADTAPPGPAGSAAPAPAAATTGSAAASVRVTEHAATPPAAASSGALVVQLGSFASRANAERLARHLRAQGFTVGVSQGSSGRHLYRVRAGPVNDRAAATELAEQLRSAGHAGSIVPQ